MSVSKLYLILSLEIFGSRGASLNKTAGRKKGKMPSENLRVWDTTLKAAATVPTFPLSRAFFWVWGSRQIYVLYDCETF